VTSSAYFTQNPSATTSSEVYSPPTLTMPQTTATMQNDDGETCDGANPPSYNTQIITAFAQSCDTTFANLGMTLGTGVLNSKAQQFGLNSSLIIPGVTTSPSEYVMSASPPLVAYSAIGQYNDEVTPLQEAMLSAAVANNGTLMKPYLIQTVTASDLSVLSSAQPTVLSQADSSAVANNVRQMMVAVTQQSEGTGYAYNSSAEGGLTIAAKTGTAQTINGQQPNAVFTAFAPAGSGQTAKIAVGVMISKGGYGASTAAPIAVDVIKAYLASVGQG
jgi:peptidoglycan glycosyltransferase